MTDGEAILKFQTVFQDNQIAVRMLGFDSTSRRLSLAIDKKQNAVGYYSMTAVFGSGNTETLEFNGDDPTQDNRPVLHAPKQYDTISAIRVVRGRRIVPAPYVPSVDCEKYKNLQSQYQSAQQQWAYFAYPQNKALRGTSDRQSKKLARQAQDRTREILQSMQWHKQSCEECKSVAVPSGK
ncbi:MAG: hypothetical protein WA817_15725 [Candidatus Acidiferrum sp.]